MKQHKHDLSKYTYSTPAYWINGLGLVGSSPKGVFGITETGRVEFTINNGKLLFSAPARLITFQPRPQGLMEFYIGPRKYKIRLYQTNIEDGPRVDDGWAPYAATTTKKARKDLGTRFDEVKSMPDDHKPLVAAVPTESTRAASRVGLRVSVYSALTYLSPILVIGFLFRKWLGDLTGFWQMALFIVLLCVSYLFILWPLATFDEWRDEADAKAFSEADGKTQAADILPAGTHAARQRVISIRAQYIRIYLSIFLGIPAAFFIVIVIFAMIDMLT